MKLKTLALHEVRLNQISPEIPVEQTVRLCPCDYKLFEYMFRSWFQYGKPCFEEAKALQRKIKVKNAHTIRDCRNRLKKAGFITSTLSQSNFSWKTVSYISMTEEGRKFAELKIAPKIQAQKEKRTKKRLSNQNNSAMSITDSEKSHGNSATIAQKVKPNKKYSSFDYRVCRRFYRDLKNSCPIKGSNNTWDEESCHVIYKLRTIDGFTEKEIEDTLNFIVKDTEPRGNSSFCFARVMRSVKQFRKKWKDDITKFAHAYNEMRMRKMENPTSDDPDSIPDALREWPKSKGGGKRKLCTPPYEEDTEFESEQFCNKTFERLMDIRHPDWRLNTKNFKEWEQYCFDLALLFDELIMDRNWNPSVVDCFFEVLEKDNQKLKFFTTDILREKTLVFFTDRIPKYFPHMPGTFNQERMFILGDGKGGSRESYEIWHIYDDSYEKRVRDFIEDQKNLDPFANATVLYDDSEVEFDQEGAKYERGTFRSIYNRSI